MKQMKKPEESTPYFKRLYHPPKVMVRHSPIEKAPSLIGGQHIAPTKVESP